MKSKNEINQEAKEIYFAIKQVMERHGYIKYDYCQSWWLNYKNFDLKSKLKTPQIMQRCKLLVRQGYLTIDKSKTSTSEGTSFKLTDKPFLND